MRFPRVTVSTAMSIDGYIDDTSPRRLLLSGAADFAAVDHLRAETDAILVGAGTIRADNPRLLVRDAERRRDRKRAGRPEHPVKVTLTRSGAFDVHAQFFKAGTGEKLVFTPESEHAKLSARLASHASVLAAGRFDVDPETLMEQLALRGIETLLIEGGSEINRLFFAAGLVDRLRLSISPRFVGEARAPRFIGPGELATAKTNRLLLVKTEALGENAILHYERERAK